MTEVDFRAVVGYSKNKLAKLRWLSHLARAGGPAPPSCRTWHEKRVNFVLWKVFKIDTGKIIKAGFMSEAETKDWLNLKAKIFRSLRNRRNGF